MKKAIAAAAVAVLMLAGCQSSADVVSHNLSQSADNFSILRRIVFYNGITGDYVLTIEGFCSLGNADPAKELSVTCKTGPDQYIKDFLGLSDNVTYFAEQLDSAGVDPAHYVVNFKPSVIVPSIQVH